MGRVASVGTIIVEPAQRGTNPTCSCPVKPSPSEDIGGGGAKDAPRTAGVSGPDAATTLTPSRERERERETDRGCECL